MGTTEPKLGLIQGQSFEDYRAIKAINHSVIKHMDTSPHHTLEALENPTEASPAMALGTAVHTLLFEPERLEETIAIMPADFNRRGKKNQDIWDSWHADNAGRTRLARHDGMSGEERFEQVIQIKDAVMRNAEAAALIDGCHGVNEVSAVWADKITGMTCKGRIDGLIEGTKTFLELKTAASASEHFFKRQMVNFGYHTAAAWYGWGLDCLDVMASGLNVDPASLYTPVFVVVETTKPLGPEKVAVYTLNQETMDLGRRKIREWINAVANCRLEQAWPGYKGGAIGAPAWAFIEHENETEGD